MQRSPEPSIEITGAAIGGIGIGSTTLNISLAAENPLPVGGSIKSLQFSIYLLKDGNEVFLGEGEKENIRIEGGGATNIEVPVQLSNPALISAAAGLIGSDIDIIVRGTAAIDLKIVAPKIPFEKKVRVEGLLKSLGI